MVEREGLMESLCGQGLKQVLWSIPTAHSIPGQQAWILVHCNTLHHGKDWRGTVREGNSLMVPPSPKARYTCLRWGMLELVHGFQFDGK